jgi:uncharacterized NTF2-like protein DUF6841
MGTMEAAIIEMYTAYGQAIESTLDPKAVVPYFQYPCFYLTPQAAIAMATPADVEALYATAIADLKARHYARSEVREANVKQLSESLAVLSDFVVHYDTEGKELRRVGSTCTLRQTEGKWKFAIVVSHDPDTILRFA